MLLAKSYAGLGLGLFLCSKSFWSNLVLLWKEHDQWHRCVCTPLAAPDPSALRRGQVSAVAAMLWHLAPVLFHHMTLSTSMCVRKRARVHGVDRSASAPDPNPVTLELKPSSKTQAHYSVPRWECKSYTEVVGDVGHPLKLVQNGAEKTKPILLIGILRQNNNETC